MLKSNYKGASHVNNMFTCDAAVKRAGGGYNDGCKYRVS